MGRKDYLLGAEDRSHKKEDNTDNRDNILLRHVAQQSFFVVFVIALASNEMLSLLSVLSSIFIHALSSESTIE